MKRRLFISLLMITMVVSMTACGKQKDTGIVVSVGDEDNESTNNKLTEETNDKNKTESESTDSQTTEADDSVKYIHGGFSSENGDVFQFNNDGTYMTFIVETGETSSGTYETDEETYITLKCTESGTSNSSDGDEAIIEEDTEEQTPADTEVSENKKPEVISELTYQLNRATVDDEFGNKVEVVVLTKGDVKITLQKQFNS